MSPNSPCVSIVVPAYNAEQYLGRTVESVQAQTFSGWEMVIVDDGARDGTAKLADNLALGDARIRVLHQRNGGLPNARNNGFAATDPDTPYVIFLDADDLWLPNTLETLFYALQAHPEWGGVHALGEYMDENDRAIRVGELEGWCSSRLRITDDHSRRILMPPDHPTTFEMLSLRNYVPSSGAMLLRREDFVRSGGFLESLLSMEDWHVWVRMSLRKPFGYLPEVLYRYRRHSDNMSGDKWRMRREDYRAARHIAENCPMTPAQAALFQRSRSVLSHLYWARDDLKRLRVTLAARHLILAVRNAFDYTARPKLSKLLPRTRQV